MAAHQFLTFTLAGEQYAVDVAQVREVLAEMELTRIPRMPEYLKGVINIRGSVVPVVDLRTKFGLPEGERTVDTSVIVMDVESAAGSITVGCLADSVQEVVDISVDEVENAPTLGTTIDARFIQGLGKKDERFIIMLDMDYVFHQEDLSAAGAVASTPDTPQAVSMH